jgi:hypothetical protein
VTARCNSRSVNPSRSKPKPREDATSTIEVLDPAGQVRKPAGLQCNPLAMPLQGRRVAVLDNSKPNFKRLAGLVAERLRDDGAVADIGYFRKENPAVGAGDALLDQIAKSADLVFTGSAD